MSSTKLSRAKIIKELAADGVDTVPKLVDRLLAFQESHLRKPHPAAVPVVAALAKIGVPSQGLKKIVHRPPKAPLYVDGVLIEPKEISRFNGQPLHYVLGTKSPDKGKPVMQAFTGSDYLNFLKTTYVASLVTEDVCPGGPGCGGPGLPHMGSYPGTFGLVAAYDQTNYNGLVLELEAGRAFSDLGIVFKGLPWMGTWNDTIQSTRFCNNIVTYFSDINFSGNQLTVPRWTDEPDLSSLSSSWSDVISSIVNWG